MLDLREAQKHIQIEKGLINPSKVGPREDKRIIGDCVGKWVKEVEDLILGGKKLTSYRPLLFRGVHRKEFDTKLGRIVVFNPVRGHKIVVSRIRTRGQLLDD